MRDRIITRVASAMIAVAILAGCSSHKTATADRSVLMADSLTATATTAGTRSYDNREMFRLMAEGVTIRFSADSIRTPTATFYRPTLEADVKAPTVAGARTQSAEASDSSSISLRLEESVDSRSAETEQTDATAVAEPVDREERRMFSITAIAALLLLWLGRYVIDRYF